MTHLTWSHENQKYAWVNLQKNPNRFWPRIKRSKFLLFYDFTRNPPAQRPDLGSQINTSKNLSMWLNIIIWSTRLSPCTTVITFTKRIYFFQLVNNRSCISWACEWSHRKNQVFQSGSFRAKTRSHVHRPRPFSLTRSVNYRWQCFYFAKSSFNVGWRLRI